MHAHLLCKKAQWNVTYASRIASKHGARARMQQFRQRRSAEDRHMEHVLRQALQHASKQASKQVRL